MLITFSGLDGAGKTSLISDLKVMLEKQGRRVQVLNMYDHVGFYAFMRFVRDCAKGAVRKGSEPPAQTDRSPSLFYNIVRNPSLKRLVYLFDILIFLAYRVYFERVKRRIVIMDRYFYDSLADVSDGRRWRHIKLLQFFTPTPDIPIFVKVGPEEAFSRKGEHSIEYLRNRYGYYQRISEWVSGAIVLSNEAPDMPSHLLDAIVSRRLNDNAHAN